MTPLCPGLIKEEMTPGGGDDSIVPWTDPGDDTIVPRTDTGGGGDTVLPRTAPGGADDTIVPRTDQVGGDAIVPRTDLGGGRCDMIDSRRGGDMVVPEDSVRHYRPGGGHVKNEDIRWWSC